MEQTPCQDASITTFSILGRGKSRITGSNLLLGQSVSFYCVPTVLDKRAAVAQEERVPASTQYDQ